MAVPWLVSSGFTVSFAALVSKLWRLNQIFSAAQRDTRLQVTEKDVIKPFVVLFGLNFVLLLAWTIVDPLRFVRLSADDNLLATAEDLETYGACQSENKGLLAFGVPLLVVNIGALIFACIQAYRARGISDEYSESKYLAFAVGSWFEVVLVGIPLLVIVDSNPTASYFVKASMIFIVSMSLLLLIYVPKFLFILQKEKVRNRGSTTTMSGVSGLSHASQTDQHHSSIASTTASYGLRVVSNRNTPADVGKDEYEGLKQALAACQARIEELEKEKRNTSIINEVSSAEMEKESTSLANSDESER